MYRLRPYSISEMAMLIRKRTQPSCVTCLSSSSVVSRHTPYPHTDGAIDRVTTAASISPPVVLPKPTFHKRPLPDHLISLSSKNGKQLFREALGTGGMESFFALSEQFVTQSEPSYCALSSLAMVLNALNFDPKKVWKGAWRWVSEETLQCETEICGHSLEKVQRKGMDFDEFESLARCHGICIKSYKADETLHHKECHYNLSQFRSHVESIASSDRAESFIIANFSRKVLGQTGDGHFSPIGGYHKEKDLVLVMDVARFKYPPFWVPLEDLWESMVVTDKTTEASRGYFILSTYNYSKSDTENEDNGTLYNNPLPPSTHHSHQHQHQHVHSKHCSHSTTSFSESIPSLKEVDTVEKIQTLQISQQTMELPTTDINTQQTIAEVSTPTLTSTSSIRMDQCPPLIRTWQDFRRKETNKKTCAECHSKHSMGTR